MMFIKLIGQKINNNSDHAWPAACSSVNGCHYEHKWWDGSAYKVFFDYPSGTPLEEKKARRGQLALNGLDTFDSSSREQEVASYMTKAFGEIRDYILAPSSSSGVITQIYSKENFRVPIIESEKRANYIFNEAAAGHSFMTIVENFNQEWWKGNEKLKLYDIYEFIVDENTAYHDNGFWWPIGGSTTTYSKDNEDNDQYFANGNPAYISIQRNFGNIVNEYGKTMYHGGIDIGTGGRDNEVYVIAVADGYVDSIGCEPYSDDGCYFEQENKEYGGSGCYITIWHGGNLSTGYAHLSKESINQYVKEGQLVDRGQVIGRVGSTGCTKDAHLHFQIYDSNDSVGVIHPLNYVFPTNPRSSK